MTDKTPSPSPAPAASETASQAVSDTASQTAAETVSEAAPEAAPAEAAAPAEQGVQDEQDERRAPAGRPVVEVSPGVHKRLTTGLSGFAMAMAACLVLVLAVYAVAPRGDEEVLPTVDYSSQLWAMRNDAPFTVHAPEGLPAGWRPNSSRLTGLGAGGDTPVAWHLGFVTPSDEYAALEQSNEKASEYVPRMTNSSKPTGTQQVGGVTWTKYHRKDKKANSLARTLPDGSSVVVTGTASYAELAVLAGALKPQAKGGADLAPSTAPTPAS
ncbi:Protein of unknown function [Actinomadura meyerae]|uniref:DUF4245 domain-containing protein n=1 Tax=Actinomadura meyerae TaxID=240840 RepID=A0A239FXE8_9ACTN|nr:DUF4245 domain-containing protein [Actinomadura meyerae]SNS61450.1 Protein of unknown function [Actinomadura meyerae]